MPWNNVSYDLSQVADCRATPFYVTAPGPDMSVPALRPVECGGIQ